MLLLLLLLPPGLLFCFRSVIFPTMRQFIFRMLCIEVRRSTVVASQRLARCVRST